jgi:glucose-1-phosphate adenylyltransferase
MTLLQQQTHPLKKQKNPTTHDMSRVATIILGGGQGSRLFPLTNNECKPAITFGGKYRLIDIPMSNSINSGCHRIFIVTQFLSKTLHDHIFKTYRPGSFTTGFVELLSIEEKPQSKNWFQGTADAIRQNLDYLITVPADYYLILSGDQLYQMNYRNIMDAALKTDADVVVATIPVQESDASRLGILKIDDDSRITDFIEKPDHIDKLSPYKLTTDFREKLQLCPEKQYLGSMGIYLFKRNALLQLLLKDMREDFGKHLIPSIVKTGHAAAYIHEGYWEDIGTIESYFKANMELVTNHSSFDWQNENHPIITRVLNLPPAIIDNTKVTGSMICEGAFIKAKEVTRSLLGPRTRIGSGTIICDCNIMGHDFYKAPIATPSIPEKLEIGQNCLIERAIVDKQTSIGDNVTLVNKKKLQRYDSDIVYIRDGIIVVPRGAKIPDGFTL